MRSLIYEAGVLYGLWLPCLGQGLLLRFLWYFISTLSVDTSSHVETGMVTVPFTFSTGEVPASLPLDDVLVDPAMNTSTDSVW